MTSDARASFASYRARLDALGFSPSSARGQNFLLDPSLHRWLVEAAAPGPDDLVLEIGVGLGFLTRELAARAGRVVGVEVDRRLFAVAERDLLDASNVVLVLADALGGKGRTLHPDVAAVLAAAMPQRGRFLVVANLPYSVSGALLAELVCLPRLPDLALLLLQREVAERVAASPGTPEYGGITGLVQSAFSARVVRHVGADVFRPRPKVASAVLRCERRADVLLEATADRRAFAAFLRALFHQRRKALRTTLPAAAASIAASAPEPHDAGLLQRRAETLSAEELVELFRGLRARSS